MQSTRSTRKKHVRDKMSSVLRKHHDDVTSDDIDEVHYLIGSYRKKHADVNGSSALYEERVDEFAVERKMLQTLENNAITESQYNTLETEAKTPRLQELLKRLKRILDSKERKDEVEETLNSILASKFKGGDDNDITEFLINLREYKFIVSPHRYEKYDSAFQYLIEDVIDTQSGNKCLDKMNLSHFWRVGDSTTDLKKEEQTLKLLSKEIAKTVKGADEMKILKGMLQAKKNILEDQKREFKLYLTFQQDNHEIIQQGLNDYIRDCEPRCNEELITRAYGFIDSKKQQFVLQEIGRILTTTKIFKREDIAKLKDLRRQIKGCRQDDKKCHDYLEIIDHLVSLGHDEVDLNSIDKSQDDSEDDEKAKSNTTRHRHMPQVNLFPIVGEQIQNKFHISIFTTNKIVYSILKHLKRVYEETHQQRLEVINTKSLGKVILNFNRKGESLIESRFCKEKFKVKYLHLYDTLILLTHTSKKKHERHIAGFCVINTFLESTYNSRNLKQDWIAFEVKYLCTHDHLLGAGTRIMNMCKWFCVAINQFHSEKDGFILQALEEEDTLRFYDKMKVLPIERNRADGLLPEQSGNQTRIWKINADREFFKVQIQTENLDLGVNGDSIRKQKETFSFNPQQILTEDHDSYPGKSSSRRQSFESSRKSSSNMATKKRNKRKIVEAMNRLPVQPSPQEYENIRKLMGEKIANKRKRFTKERIKTLKMRS
jgi:hypothetical protein